MSGCIRELRHNWVFPHLLPCHHPLLFFFNTILHTNSSLITTAILYRLLSLPVTLYLYHPSSSLHFPSNILIFGFFQFPSKIHHTKGRQGGRTKEIMRWTGDVSIYILQGWDIQSISVAEKTRCSCLHPPPLLCHKPLSPPPVLHHIPAGHLANKGRLTRLLLQLTWYKHFRLQGMWLSQDWLWLLVKNILWCRLTNGQTDRQTRRTRGHDDAFTTITTPANSLHTHAPLLWGECRTNVTRKRHLERLECKQLCTK